jgi:hypothetical protein
VAALWRQTKESNMLIGQTVLAPNATQGSGAFYYSPWMPRQGNVFQAVIEVIRASDTSNSHLRCTVQTKNNEDSDASGSVTDLVSFNANMSVTARFTALKVQDVTGGCLELVRYKYEAYDDSALQWIHFRALAPIWEPN